MVTVHAIFNDYKIDINHINVIQQEFLNYKKMAIGKTYHILLNLIMFNRKESLTIN